MTDNIGSTQLHMQPVRVSILLECLQICLWDDERRRLLGRDTRPAHESAAMADAAQPRPMREVFCLSMDSVSLQCSRQITHGELLPCPLPL
jgi:hypothetical protein